MNDVDLPARSRRKVWRRPAASVYVRNAWPIRRADPRRGRPVTRGWRSTNLPAALRSTCAAILDGPADDGGDDVGDGDDAASWKRSIAATPAPVNCNLCPIRRRTDPAKRPAWQVSVGHKFASPPARPINKSIISFELKGIPPDGLT